MLGGQSPGARSWDTAGLGAGSWGHRISWYKLRGSAKLFSMGALDAPILARGGAGPRPLPAPAG